jgi:hypothetical protein
MKTIIVSIFLFLLIDSGFSQTIPTDSLYLGQIPPTDIPKIFAPGLLIKKDTFALDRVTFSLDGTEFYFSQNTKWFDPEGAKIKYFKYIGNKWTGPILLNEHYYGQNFSPDGKVLYFIGGESGVVMQCKRTDSGWSNPTIYFKKNYGLYDFMLTQSGNIYAGSNYGRGDINDWNNYNICRFNFSGKDSVIQNLGTPLNEPGFNGDFFIAKDESYIIISAKETPDFECELYISYHKADNTWTNPKSLGSFINDGIAHRWGEYVTPDNKYLFYSRGHDEKDCNIYWVRFDKLFERLKHTNFEPYLKNQIKNQSESIGHSFVYTIPDSTFIDDDGNNTLTYSASLDNGNTLPSWLSFNPITKTFSGTPKTIGKIVVKVTATDMANAFVSCNFEFQIKDKNPAPNK